MPTQINAGQQITDARGDRSPAPVRDAADTATEQPSDAAGPPLLRVQDLMVQLVRQGVDISLRSLQLWADLARPFGPTALGLLHATPTVGDGLRAP